jgi:hypothetical protein
LIVVRTVKSQLNITCETFVTAKHLGKFYDHAVCHWKYSGMFYNQTQGQANTDCFLVGYDYRLWTGHISDFSSVQHYSKSDEAMLIKYLNSIECGK